MLSNFSDFTRVAILDDRKEEGEGIKNALESIQIPSLFFHVQNNTSLPESPFKNIRLVFIDLIFGDSGSQSDAQIAGNALSKLSKVVGKTGFYVLVIWSGHTTEDVATVFRSQLERQTDFAKPYQIVVLQKTSFKNRSGGFKGPSIIREINKQFATFSSMQVFSDWERLTTNSVSKIASEIAEQKSDDDLSKTINSLAFAYGGKSKPKDGPMNALMAFNDIFRSVVSDEIVENDFKNLHKKIKPGDLDNVDKAKLNTYLMFTPDISEGPGSIFKVRLTKKQKSDFLKSMFTQDIVTLGAACDKMVPICIDVTPLCNAAQGNGKNKYYLDGVLHPENFTGTSAVKVHKYCHMIEKSFWDEVNGENFRLSFNLKLFHSDTYPNQESLKKKLRDNLVIELQHEVSGYVSRPGHVLI